MAAAKMAHMPKKSCSVVSYIPKPTSLPSELWTEVFQFLSHNGNTLDVRHTLAQVCKEFRGLVASRLPRDTLCWTGAVEYKEDSKQSVPVLTVPQIHSILSHYAVSLTSIRLHGDGIIRPFYPTRLRTPLTNLSFPALKRLELNDHESGYDQQGDPWPCSTFISHIVSLFPNLLHLDLDTPMLTLFRQGQVAHNQLLAQPLYRLPHLRTLGISLNNVGHHIQQIDFARFPHLQHFACFFSRHTLLLTNPPPSIEFRVEGPEDDIEPTDELLPLVNWLDWQTRERNQTTGHLDFRERVTSLTFTALPLYSPDVYWIEMNDMICFLGRMTHLCHLRLRSSCPKRSPLLLKHVDARLFCGLPPTVKYVSLVHQRIDPIAFCSLSSSVQTLSIVGNHEPAPLCVRTFISPESFPNLCHLEIKSCVLARFSQDDTSLEQIRTRLGANNCTFKRLVHQYVPPDYLSQCQEHTLAVRIQLELSRLEARMRPPHPADDDDEDEGEEEDEGA